MSSLVGRSFKFNEEANIDDSYDVQVGMAESETFFTSNYLDFTNFIAMYDSDHFAVYYANEIDEEYADVYWSPDWNEDYITFTFTLDPDDILISGMDGSLGDFENWLEEYTEEVETVIPSIYYDIIVSATTGGTLTANVESAEEGDIITLTPVPAAGYQFIEYQTESNITISNHLFTMPKSDVSVTAIFDTIPKQGIVTDKLLISIANVIRQKSGVITNLSFPTDFVSALNSMTTIITEKDVNLMDYDGTILYSYTALEFANLSALPNNPTHQGLTSKGWNWNLSDAKTYVASYGKLNIGLMYVPSDGKTRIYIHLDNINKTIPIRFSLTKTNGATIDWGDGTVAEETDSYSNSLSHTYATGGDYTITLNVVKGTLEIGSDYGISYVTICGNRANNYGNLNTIRKVEIGNNIILNNHSFDSCGKLKTLILPYGLTTIGSSVFTSCKSLKYITIPNTVTNIYDNAFQNNYALTRISLPNSIESLGSDVWQYCHILQNVTYPSGLTYIGYSAFYNCFILDNFIIPNTVTTIEDSAFYGCEALTDIILPNGITTIKEYAFFDCESLSNITIPSATTSIGNSAFYDCRYMKEVHLLPTTPPSLGTNVFSNVASDCIIYVPYSADHSVLAAYKAATNWANYADKILEEPNN